MYELENIKECTEYPVVIVLSKDLAKKRDDASIKQYNYTGEKKSINNISFANTFCGSTEGVTFKVAGRSQNVAYIYNLTIDKTTGIHWESSNKSILSKIWDNVMSNLFNLIK